MLFIYKSDVYSLNEYLKKGWKVVDIRPISQLVGSSGGCVVGGDYGCYVLIERK